MCVFPFLRGGKITDIESTGYEFIRFKDGHQICWGIEVSGNLSHDSACNNTDGGTKTITFPVPFNCIPTIAISPASAYAYGGPHNNIINPPAAWYHHESMTGFIAELSSAVKLTWIAVGTWK